MTALTPLVQAGLVLAEVVPAFRRGAPAREGDLSGIRWPSPRPWASVIAT